jgi:putative hemolysin
MITNSNWGTLPRTNLWHGAFQSLDTYWQCVSLRMWISLARECACPYPHTTKNGLKMCYNSTKKQWVWVKIYLGFFWSSSAMENSLRVYLVCRIRLFLHGFHVVLSKGVPSDRQDASGSNPRASNCGERGGIRKHKHRMAKPNRNMAIIRMLLIIIFWLVVEPPLWKIW